MARWCFFLALFFVTSCRVAELLPEYALKGQEVNLKPDIAGRPDEILWKHDGNKVVEFNGKEQDEFIPYKNRITLDWHSAQLSIKDLRAEDSGVYELEAYMKNTLDQSQFTLVVLDKVRKPTISCKMNVSSSAGTLTCSADSRGSLSLMKFEWRSHGGVQPGPQLTVSLGDKHDEVYNCSVSNPLSTETATFKAKDCSRDESSSVALTASLVTIFIILLLVVLGIVFCYRSHKACFAKTNDLEKQSPSGGTDDKKAAEDEETVPFFNRAPTLPSHQPLNQVRDQDPQDERPKKGAVGALRKHFESVNGERNSSKKLQKGSKKNKDNHENTPSPPPSPRNESASHLDQSDLNSNDKGGAEADQHRDEEVPQGSDEPGPAAVLADSSDVESPTAPQHPGSKKNKDDRESTPSPPPSPHHDKGGAEADQHRDEEIPQSSDEPGPAAVLAASPDVESPTAPQPPDLERESDGHEKVESPPSNGISSTLSQIQHAPNMEPKDSTVEHKQDINLDQNNCENAQNLYESDPDVENTNKSDDCNEEEQTSETRQLKQDSNLNTSESNQQEMDKPVCPVEKESDSVAEEIDKDQEQKVAPALQPQSLTATKQDDRDTDTCQESADKLHHNSDQEEETRNDSHEPSEHAEDRNEVQGGSQKENQSLGEGEEGQKKDEVIT